MEAYLIDWKNRAYWTLAEALEALVEELNNRLNTQYNNWEELCQVTTDSDIAEIHIDYISGNAHVTYRRGEYNYKTLAITEIDAVSPEEAAESVDRLVEYLNDDAKYHLVGNDDSCLDYVTFGDEWAESDTCIINLREREFVDIADETPHTAYIEDSMSLDDEVYYNNSLMTLSEALAIYEDKKNLPA